MKRNAASGKVISSSSRPLGSGSFASATPSPSQIAREFKPAQATIEGVDFNARAILTVDPE